MQHAERQADQRFSEPLARRFAARLPGDLEYRVREHAADQPDVRGRIRQGDAVSGALAGVLSQLEERLERAARLGRVAQEAGLAQQHAVERAIGGHCLRDAPDQQVDRVVGVVEAFGRRESVLHVRRETRQALLGERHHDRLAVREEVVEPARLEALPDGTPGREYARFIRANQIDPLGNLLALSRPKNLLEYQFWRAYKLHDVLHVVLDGDATALGEVPIVAYSLGQARSTAVRAPAMALCVLLLHMALRRTDQFQPAVRLAAEWMRRGEQTRGYATHRLEDWMDRPVSEVRSLVLAPA